MRRSTPAWLVAIAPILACAEPSGEGASEGSGPGGKGDALGDLDDVVAVTMTSVEALDRDVSEIDPPLSALVPADPLTAADYLQPMGPLGFFGPIGPYGPLGVLGPVGDDVWNPSTAFASVGAFDAFSAMLAENDGPLSASGPLGAGGPLSRDAWADGSRLDVTADFAAQLLPGGVFAPLGPVGPLGALGPLGPLGPVGAHGYAADAGGQFIAEGECTHNREERGVCRTALVAWDDTEVRTWPLLEDYDEAFAAAMPDNDTSFMVRGSLLEDDEVDAFAFTSAEDQWVTVVAFGQWTKWTFSQAMGLLAQSAATGLRLPTIVPLVAFPFNLYDHVTSFDDVDLELHVTLGERTVTVASDSQMFGDFVHVHVPAGATLRAEVSVASTWSAPWRIVDADYRLLVVGSTRAWSGTAVSGPHQIAPSP